MAERSLLIYIVEDNEWYNKLLVHTLSLNPDYEVRSFFNAAELYNALKVIPDIITLDYRLPDSTGDEILKRVKSLNPEIEVIVISDQQDIEVAVELLKGGAFDYIVKSEDIRNRLLNLINHIQTNASLKDRVSRLQQEVERKYDFRNTIIGNSPAIQKIFGMIEKSLLANLTVSISGETGTGKELVAKAIHYNSNRKKKSFVAVNLAACPADLVESELFGHEKGAFTGAMARRMGKFEEADGGTIFLDEIGEVDSNIQKKLLRVLQEQEITRVGGNEVIKVDCRVITATNKDLMEEVKKGRFREDLYYRLYGLPIVMPPLRERGDDIIILAKYFLDQFTEKNKLGMKTIAEKARHKLLAYSWPGNVRELKSVIELSAVLAAEAEIKDSDITLSRSEDVLADLITRALSLREFNYRIVRFYMDRFDNDTARVAKQLDIGQSTVYRLIKEFEQ